MNKFITRAEAETMLDSHAFACKAALTDALGQVADEFPQCADTLHRIAQRERGAIDELVTQSKARLAAAATTNEE